MTYLWSSILYIIADEFFTIAMGLTTCIGLFIGATIFDGMLEQVKKAMIALGCYAVLIASTNASRIVPLITDNHINNDYQPLAGIATLLFVTIFYLLGMILGVFVTKMAHKRK